MHWEREREKGRQAGGRVGEGARVIQKEDTPVSGEEKLTREVDKRGS